MLMITHMCVCVCGVCIMRVCTHHHHVCVVCVRKHDVVWVGVWVW